MSESRAAQQRELYGSTLSERFTAVMKAYGLTQRGLAQTLGLSAPMLSQLMSAQRIKIGNPAVFERLLMLESRTGDPDPTAVIDEVRASTPVLSTQSATTQPLPDALAALATPAQLDVVAAAARDVGATRLADVLSLASRRMRDTG